MKKLEKFIGNYFKAISQTFFFENPFFGAALLLLFLGFEPKLFIFGFTASLVGYGYSLSYSTPKALKDWGLITINCFFFGIAMASLFQKTPLFYLCFVLGAAGIPLVTKAVFEVLQHWKLSPFIIPYILMVWIMVLAGHGSLLQAQAVILPDREPFLLQFLSEWEFVPRILWSVFQGIGRLLFIPNPLFGAAILALVTLFSPRRGIYFLIGTLLATLVSFAMSGTSDAWEFGAYNFSAGLVGLGLASFPDKFKPGTILFFCILSCLMTMAVDQFLKGLQLPILSLPYVLTLWFGFLSRLPRLNLSWAPSASPGGK